MSVGPTEEPAEPPASRLTSDGARELGARDGQAIDVSVVLPCLNEEQTVASCVGKARRWFEAAQAFAAR